MRVKLVLSGGAARGIAHIGVLKALEELGVDVIRVSGVSAGALVGAFYCSGYTPEEMLKIVKSKDWLKTIRPRVPKYGLFSFSRAERFLREHLEIERIEQLTKKLYICVLDIKSGKTFYFDSGELYPLLLGSCALPGIFEPVRYRDHLLVDGGITNNLPVEPLLNTEGLLVGVDVNPTNSMENVRSIAHIIIRSFLLAVRSNVDKRKELCHIIIEPKLQGFSTIDLWKADELYKAGYIEAKRVIGSYVKAHH
ncbi:MAG: patatin-like phospholipase family protein [Aquificaceae bacterium]